ncbi:recombinase family protein [Sphingomonas sp.]|uniref:recombinase family protein n=1 Tax=Sphingomonas sp. TaxID=28214 RepID=UPI0025DE1AE1|nr:recombinase family protein [Sphingomonas sp.]
MPSVILPTSTSTKRCAIYARKSSEHGLEQDFNSLEAQHELCSAYITSQKHRGWAEVDKVYIDAAQSGGSLDRPALQALLEDVEAGQVDIVVIYKLDRLSRSLLDFVRLMAVFDRNSASFVCITQNFDTGDSLGRLIMNILLTFAQFERELTGDRIRDKKQAMAARGFWTGGRPPFGYDYIDKQLQPNTIEAASVKFIYRRYLALRSIMAVWRECSARGIRSKPWVSHDGEVRGDQPIHRATVRSILCNPIYKGDIKNVDKTYPGQHPALVTKANWKKAAQLRLETHSKRNLQAPADLLPSVIYDCFGRRMSMVRKYRDGRCERHYYSDVTAWGRKHQVPRMRARAAELEKLVLAAISATLSDRKEVRAMLLTIGRRSSRLERIAAGCETASRRVTNGVFDQQIAIMAALVVRVELSTERLKIILRASELERFLEWDGFDFFAAEKRPKSAREITHLIDVPATGGRLSRRLRLPIGPRAANSPARPDPKLLLLMKQVRHAQRLVDTERLESVASLASRMSRNTGHFMKLLRLNYLAPDIVTAIFDGTQPASLTRRTLLDANLPTDWPMQRKLFGFPEQPPLQTSERY